MEKLSEIVRSIGFYVREANFATVGDFWKDIVNFWNSTVFTILKAARHRSYEIRVVNLTAGESVLYPENSVVTAINHEYLEHYFIHFETTDIGNTCFLLFSRSGGGGESTGIPAEKEDAEIFEKNHLRRPTETASGHLLRTVSERHDADHPVPLSQKQ